MTNGTMLERVAKAIDAASQPPGRPDYKALMENCARAAIEAMREPTDEMRMALHSDEEFMQAWRDAIDAVLSSPAT